MNQSPVVLYAVSDATGDLTVNIAVAAARQFQELDSEIRRRSMVNTEEKVDEVVLEAKGEGAIILYTLVSSRLRQILMESAKAQGVTAIDVMGPVLDNIAAKAQLLPSDQPGLQYKVTRESLKRTETMTYTVRHDDGQGLETLDEADIIMSGISRTSKTPLSIYLAYRGFKVANIPIVKGVDIPSELFKVDRRKLVGLTIDPEELASLRISRLKKLGRPLDEAYASLEYITEELAYQRQVFVELGNIPVVNMTHKAIEEIATEILTVLGR